MDTIRWHTEGRRQPMLIGKDSAGHKIWGGPYTIYQVLGVLVLVPALALTRGLWGPGMSPLAAGFGIVGITALGVWGLGMVDFTRNPLLAARSALALIGGGADRRLTSIKPSRARPQTVLLPGPVTAIAQTLVSPPPQDEAQLEVDPLVEERFLSGVVQAPAHLEDPDIGVEERFLSGVDQTPAHLEDPDILPDPAGPQLQVRSPLEQFLAAAALTRKDTR